MLDGQTQGRLWEVCPPCFPTFRRGTTYGDNILWSDFFILHVPCTIPAHPVVRRFVILERPYAYLLVYY